MTGNPLTTGFGWFSPINVVESIIFIAF